MNLIDRTHMVAQLLDTFFHSLTPFDIVLHKFFRKNKWIGANDRREIAELSYAIFRNFETLRLYTTNVTGNYGKYFVLAHLKLQEKISDQKICDLFHPLDAPHWQFEDFDAKFLKSLNTPLDLPPHVRLNYPRWLEPYLQRAFPPERFESEMLALNQPGTVDLRVNTLKSDKNTVRKMLLEENFQPEDLKFAPEGLRILNARIGRNNPILRCGLAEVQAEGSQLIAKICGASPENTVVDLCAGAGGKTLALAAHMQNKGRIFALDTNVIRLSKAKIRLRRANANNVFCQELTNKWIKRHAECADIVLVDAPCSGTGTWRRNPEMRSRLQENDIQELIELQQKILDTAQYLVKKNGKLVYATCSILVEENENQIKKFLEKYPFFRKKDINFPETSLCTNGYLLLSPANHGTDGFFAALLEKKESALDCKPSASENTKTSAKIDCCTVQTNLTQKITEDIGDIFK
ncbi:MAG: RsmB/NOP family class I SAM-dependent RNA methyltransferase [Holosporaceae bacterium]|jgi:16S rRNA (cytosine967-C5)-methyltransferase|nr:RsmB/NOP family class I SAM-dependent RNA methyltransferase [Holosporaceae bacterium]